MSAFIEPEGELSLRNAIVAALVGSPELKAYSSEIRSARARQVQAGLTADPELGLEFDEFGGNKGFKGTESIETTLKLSQLIESGGKVAIREKVSAFNTRLAELDYESKERDVCTDLAATFIRLLVIQKKVELAEEQVEICTKMADKIDMRVQAGKTGSLDSYEGKDSIVKS